MKSNTMGEAYQKYISACEVLNKEPLQFEDWVVDVLSESIEVVK